MAAVARKGVAGLWVNPGRSCRRTLLTSSVTHQVKEAAVVGSASKATPLPVQDIPGFDGLLSFFREPDLKNNKYDKKRPIVFFKWAFNKWGPLVKMVNPFSFPSRLVLVGDPDDVETILRATMDQPWRVSLESMRMIREEAHNNFFEGKTGLITSNGEEWWRVRSRVQPHMMKPSNINSYISLMDQVTLDFIDRMAAFQAEFGEMPSDFQTELYKWGLESVGLVALNRRLGCLDPHVLPDSDAMRMIQAVNNMFEDMQTLETSMKLWRIFPSSTYRRLKKTHDLVFRIGLSAISDTEEALKAQGEDADRELTLIETLLMTPGLTHKDVITVILDMLVAGIDTTSNSLGFALYCLARNPEVQGRLQEEVDSVLGSHQGPLTTHHLAKMSYLKAVVKETMRMFPVALGFMRTLNQDLVLSGYLVPKGWVAIICSGIIGQDEKHFPRAKEFVPERWLRHKPLGPIHPYSYTPFSVGTRMCIGRRIAEQEMYIFLTRVMQRFTVDYKYEDVELISRLIGVSSQPLRFNITERRAPA